MPTPTKGPRLGGSPAHERLMLANLATSLFKHGKITTTETKAKRLRPLAEQLITKAKRGDLHARRRVLHRRSGTRTWSYALFDEIAPRYANRPGGYTRIVKAGPRKGDAAPMAIIELVEELEVADAGQGGQEDRRPQGRAAGQGRGARPRRRDRRRADAGRRRTPRRRSRRPATPTPPARTATRPTRPQA